MIKEFSVSTENKYQLIDITGKVKGAVRESGARNGLILVFTPHSVCILNSDVPFCSLAEFNHINQKFL